MSNTPQIRFAGFTDAWEQRKLHELGSIMTGSTPSTSNSSFYSDDGIPWVTPTDITSNLISNTPRKLSKEGERVARVVPPNTILVTCIASIGKNALLQVKGSFNQQINSLTPYDDNDPYFLLSESELWSAKMKRQAAAATMQIVNKTEFSEIETLIPTKPEQHQIGTYFHTLDTLITLHQRKCDALQKFKKSMLQKMFPQNGESVPEIRFAGFTDAWEQRKLGECFAERSERSADGELIAVTINSGVVKASDLNRHDNSSEDKSNYKVVRKNDIAYNSMRMWQGASGFSRYDGILSPAYTVLIPKEGVNSHFFAYMFKLYYMIHEFEINSQGLTKDTWNLKYPALSPISIFMPKYEEQTKIADYFEKLDTLITLHQREYT